MSAGVDALGLEIPVTTSVGIAFGRPGGTDGDRLIAEADAAMYRAKATGKGRYCLHLPAPAPS